jgi:hypothetical protein
MSNTYLLHIDTAQATTVTPSGQASISKVDGNPFQCTVILGNRHRALKSISLKNAQVPIGFFNVRAPYNTINVNSVVSTVIPGNYTYDAFQSALNTAVTSGVGVFGRNTLTNQMTFLSSSGTATFNVQPETLGSFLGFTNGQQGSFITGTNSYIINFDTYLSVWIENLGTSSLEPSQITFKIPVDVGSGGIVHYSELKQHEQFVPVSDMGVRVDRLNITVLDRFGNLLNNNGLDWSFTLQVTSDT